MSRSTVLARFSTRRAKSLLRNPLAPVTSRPKNESPAQVSRKRTFSLISETNETPLLLAAKDAEIFKLNEEIVELKAGMKRLEGVTASVLQRKVTAMEEEMERLVKENERLQRGFVEASGRVEELVSALEAAKGSGEEKLAALQQILHALQMENSDLLAKDRASKEDLAKLSGIVKDMKAMSSSLEEKITTLSVEMEEVNKEKYELSIRLQSLTPPDDFDPVDTDLSPAQFSAINQVQKNRISYLEAKKDALKKDVSDLRARLASQTKDTDMIFAGLNKQITDLSLAKSHMEAVNQHQAAELEAVKVKLVKTKARIQELNRTNETQRSTIRMLQSDILQLRSEAHAQKTKNQLKSRDLATVQSKITTAMESLWQKEAELLHKETLRLRLVDELRELKTTNLLVCKSKPCNCELG